VDQPVNRHHKRLTLDRWRQFSAAEQMANIGSDVIRAINSRNKGHPELSQQAIERALELLDLSLDAQAAFPRLREFARVREVLVDYFYGENQYNSTDELWHKYFDEFTYLARKDR
jgi:hypothetical protein